MTRLEKDEIERLLSVSVADVTDKHSAQSIIQKYIQPGYKCCMTCDPQIRLMFRKLRGWWDAQNKSTYQFIKPLN
jgi:hypothetical protein